MDTSRPHPTQEKLSDMCSDPTDVIGQLLSAKGDTVAGWAWSPANGRRRIQIEIVETSGKVVATGTAAVFDRSLIENGIGDGFHAFRLQVPTKAFVGHEMLVRGRIAGSHSPLSGGPFSLFQPADPAAHLIMQLSPPDFQARVNAPPLRLINGAEAHQALLKAYAPSEQIDFMGLIQGDGWIRVQGGCRLEDGRNGTIRLLRLHDQPSRLVMCVSATERAAIEVRVHCDDQAIRLTAMPTNTVDELTIHGQLPGAGAIRTPVTLRMQAGSDVVFRKISLISANRAA